MEIATELSALFLLLFVTPVLRFAHVTVRGLLKSGRQGALHQCLYVYRDTDNRHFDSMSNAVDSADDTGKH